MKTGMLWFDNDPKLDLFSKVQRAAVYYKEKYGQDANMCYVHPNMINEEKPITGFVEVCSKTTILPHHYWIGVHHTEAFMT